MMDILKRIFIGIIVGMSIFFLKTEVFALTVESRYQITEPLVNGSYVNAGTIMQYNNTSSAYTFGSIFVRFGQTFLPDSTYRISFDFRVDNNFYTIHYTCPTGYSLTSGFELLNSSCSEIGNRVAHVEIAFKTPDSSSSYVTLGLKYTVIFPKNYSTAYQVMADTWDVTNIDSTYEAVINNTQIIGNAIDGVTNYIDFQTVVIESIRDLIYDISNATIGDESATTYSGSNYSGVNVQGYDSAHNSGTSAGGSGLSGANNLSFDTQSYDDASSTIWDFIYRFLSLNSKLLTYLTSILTLGFVKVVLNR